MDRRYCRILWMLIIFSFAFLTAMAGCQSYPRYSNTPGYEKPMPDDEDSQPADEPVQSPQINESLMARIIDDYLGTPYKKGGTSINGIDCSSLIRNIYYELDGRSLPPDVRRMYRAGREIERPNLVFGDLVFFGFKTRSPSHVGMYIGNGKFVHASESRGVIISSLDEEIYRSNYSGARRLK